MKFEIEHVEDSFKVIHEMPDNCVDVVITDPPYNAHVQSNLISGTAAKAHLQAGGAPGGIPRIKLPFAPVESFEFVRELVRVAKRWCVVFCAVEDLGRIQMSCPASFVRGGIWYKPNSKGQLTADRPAAACEGIAFLHKPGRKQWNGRGSYNFFQCDDDAFPSEETTFVCNGTRGEPDRHPNQKPLNLCLELVSKVSNRGETILDPFMGSGRFGEAAARLDRTYFGLDSDRDWCSKAFARIAAAKFPTYAMADEDCFRLCAAPNPWPKVKK